ncbi:MAG: twin-arginine translocase TatA/TatE family subunit [Opitutaceae bacterium]|nr:twin-arginine translocase TatA/TatE family subunit [Opitutaceae bacterium]
MFGLGAPELLLIFGVLILLFGATKLPALAKGLGKSVKEFKKASNSTDDDEEDTDTKKPAAKPAPPKSNDSN